MKDKIQKLIAEIIGDGFTVEIKPVSVGNASSDFGAGVTTYLSVYTDGEGDQAIYVNGKLESHNATIYGHDVVRVADGRLVRMRSAVLDESVGKWPENESELIDMIGGHQAGIDAGAAIGAPDRDGLVLRSEWNAEEGCFEDSIVEPEKESDWQPKIDGWVRLPEGKVAKVKCVKIINGSVLYGFHGTNIMYTLGTLKPWTPSVGDSVKVIRENSMNRGLIGTVKRDDGKYSASYLVETESGMGWFTAECLEPAVPPTDHIADANEMVKSIEDLEKELEAIVCDHHVCELSKPTGVTCPPDSCDIDDGVRELPATDHIADANEMVPGDLLVDTTVKFNDGSRTVPRSSGWTLDVDPDAYIGMLTTQLASTMPNGWMVLHTDAKTEPRVVGDRFFRVTKGHWEELTQDNIDQANAQSWAAIRKIPSVVLESQELLGSKVEDPAVQGHPDHVEGVWVEEAAKDPETIARYDSNGRNVTELAGLWTDGDTQYREPTYADLANGPIEVEVCNDNTLETNWGKRMLYAVLPAHVVLRFVCEDPDLPESIYRWKHARVKVR